MTRSTSSGGDVKAEGDANNLLSTVITAAELHHRVFPELVQHVLGIIIEGFGIVAGPPKLGKSFFTLVIALAVSAGGYAFGKLKCDPRPVLLLALEDSERRLQTRIRALYGSDIPPHNLHIMTSIQPGLLIPTISAWLLHHPTGLVILDTLGRARQQRNRGDDPYLADYQAGVALKNVVDAFPGSALLGVHHTRKAASDDFVDDLSGTLGLAGSADYLLVLRRKRQSDEATLQITGRDAPEGEYAFSIEGGNWVLAGGGLAEAAAAAVNRRNETQLGERARDVLAIVNSRADAGELTCAADIVAKVGISQDQARVYLNRLADAERILKTGKGVYSSVTPVTTVTEPENLQRAGLALGLEADRAPVTAGVTAGEFPNGSATSDNAASVTDETGVTPTCTECESELLPGNSTGFCAECQFIARQQAITDEVHHTHFESSGGDLGVPMVNPVQSPVHPCNERGLGA
ncbi:AAA family ATPase [Mycolicibacterium sp. D5.8-2]|uniref:AAA family ATPase n=1 Tax=Mycolicibacterium sp. D5.8-2 TaxID=3085903 RepID=UPI00298BF1AA|nr:AAA family ATPase [Mycolicibacterium sp. D5.8-2]MDW5609728.1 AAA family ATPase [Mycolicibacterium sp. D5.8-2]